MRVWHRGVLWLTLLSQMWRNAWRGLCVYALAASFSCIQFLQNAMTISQNLVQPTGGANHSKLTFRWWHIALGVVALAIVGLVLFVTIQPVQVLPRMTLAPGYALVNQDGNLVTSEDARGALTLYNFTYTGCTAPDCPETGASMAALQARLQNIDTGDIPVHLVTISFDPEHDTPAALKAWANAQGADPAVWTVATGDATRLKNIIGGGFSTYYGANEAGGWDFDPAFVLVDGNGIIRTKYRTATPDPALFERDLGLVLAEVANSSGANKLAYDAAHLFLCYPE